MATKISTVRGLYKFLLKETTKLPDDAAKFYRTQIRAVSFYANGLTLVDFLSLLVLDIRVFINTLKKTILRE